MAYAAVISLKQTIKGLVHSSRISLISSTRETLESAHNEVASLQKVVETLSSRSSERLDGLDGEIRDAAHELEDVLELHESEQLYSDVEVKKAIGSLAEAVKKLEVEYVEELSKPDDDAATTVPPPPPIIDFGVEMVGRSKMFTEIRGHLLGRMRPDDMCFFLLLGEVGSGRRFVAKTVYEDIGKDKQFDCCAWVTIGAQYQFKEVLMQFISQVFEHRRYVIVLDDVRDVEVVEYLRRSLPNGRDGSIVFVTSSVKEMLLVTDYYISFYTPAQYFEESIWLTLRGVICGDGPISPELEEAGKKIIHNCRGSLISAAKALLFLLKTDNTLEQWRGIASDQENPIFVVGDEISEMSDIKAQMQSYNWDMDDARESLIVQIISVWGYIEEVENINKVLQPQRFFSKMQILSLLGMAGIGKSTVAREVFNNELILCHFDHRVWVTLGPKYQTKQVLIDILAQIYPSIDMKGDEELARELCIRLAGKRCLIVLDDICSQEPLHHLKNVIPYITGITLVTTRLAQVAKFTKADLLIKMKLLDQEESWCLFRQKVFRGESIPFELEEAGRKIAKKCEGLPLLILTVADQLLKVEKTVENWNNIENLVFKNAHDEISTALLPSYQSLPQHLKLCFLYMGVFRNENEIPLSKLTNLLTAEGFLETNQLQTVDEFVVECLSELVDRSLLMAQNKALDSQIKTCRLHPIFWHLSNSEAAKNKFFHAVNSYDSFPLESIKSQRRLSIRNSILLGMKDVHDSIASITTAHSLLCVGPPHRYPVPIDFDLRLLRVMDALTIRFYEFPVEVVRLVHLRYLSLTCNGNLPTSISNLWKLQYLIVKRYMNIKSLKSSSPLPMEIWDMKELIHLQVMGGRLPDHKCGTNLLKLSTLLDVSAECCTEAVLERIPNLTRLGIRIELAPDDEGSHFHYLNNIHLLRGLESLKCVVVNPQIRSEVPPPYFMFPPSLKNLSLNGMGYPWEYMGIISELGNLQVLKLKGYAFQGPQWIMDHRTRFNKLRFLLVEDTNLVKWEIKFPILGQLEGISFKHCYKLQELPMCLPYQCFTKMEIVNCSPKIMKWAEYMKKEMAITDGEVVTHVSWHGHSKEEED